MALPPYVLPAVNRALARYRQTNTSATGGTSRGNGAGTVFIDPITGARSVVPSGPGTGIDLSYYTAAYSESIGTYSKDGVNYGPRQLSYSSGGFNLNAAAVDRSIFQRNGPALIRAVRQSYAARPATTATSTERAQWLQSHYAALLARLEWMQTRVQQISTDAAGYVPESDLQGLTTVLTAGSFFPVVGPFFRLATVFSAGNDAASQRANAQAYSTWVKQTLTGYQTDATELTQLIKAVQDEAAQLGLTLANAPTPGVAWYWWLLAFLLFLVVYRAYQRRNKRTRR